MASAGLSSLGIEFGYGLESASGEKPSSFTRLTRINSIGSVDLSPERIDASALEDLATRYISGRADTSDFAVTINLTEETKAEWETLIEAYGDGNKRMWFEVVIPGLTDANFIVAQPPKKLPLPELSQNELLTVEINLTIEEYIGFDTKVALS